MLRAESLSSAVQSLSEPDRRMGPVRRSLSEFVAPPRAAGISSRMLSANDEGSGQSSGKYTLLRRYPWTNMRTAPPYAVDC